MKKIALIATLALAAGMASAADFGARVGYNGGTEKNSAGVTVSDRFGALGAEAAFDRSTDGKLNVNRYSLVGAYDVAKVVGATVAVKVGGAYIDPSKGADGYAGLVGVGVSYPVAKNVALVGDYAYQKGQARVSSFNGNTVSAGVKVSF